MTLSDGVRVEGMRQLVDVGRNSVTRRIASELFDGAGSASCRVAGNFLQRDMDCNGNLMSPSGTSLIRKPFIDDYTRRDRKLHHLYSKSSDIPLAMLESLKLSLPVDADLSYPTDCNPSQTMLEHQRDMSMNTHSVALPFQHPDSNKGADGLQMRAATVRSKGYKLLPIMFDCGATVIFLTPATAALLVKTLHGADGMVALDAQGNEVRATACGPLEVNLCDEEGCENVETLAEYTYTSDQLDCDLLAFSPMRKLGWRCNMAPDEAFLLSPRGKRYPLVLGDDDLYYLHIRKPSSTTVARISGQRHAVKFRGRGTPTHDVPVASVNEKKFEKRQRNHKSKLTVQHLVEAFQGTADDETISLIVDEVKKQHEAEQAYIVLHNTFNHNSTILDALIKDGTIKDVRRPSSFYCKSCDIIRGATHASFSDKASSSIPNVTPFHTWVMDICGPFNVDDVNGFLYMFGGLDSASDYYFFQPLRLKSDTPNAIIALLAHIRQLLPYVELAHGSNLSVPAVFVSDRGGEFTTTNGYTNSITDQLLKGFKRKFTSANTPESGSARIERAWREIVDVAKKSLLDSGLLKKYFFYAVGMAVHHHNYLPDPSNRIDSSSSPAKSLGLPADDLGRFVPFGAYAILTVPHNSKMAPKSTVCCVLGYNPDGAGYQVLCMDGTIVASIHVTVLPHIVPDWRDDEGARQDPFECDSFRLRHCSATEPYLDTSEAKSISFSDLDDAASTSMSIQSRTVGAVPGSGGSRSSQCDRAGSKLFTPEVMDLLQQLKSQRGKHDVGADVNTSSTSVSNPSCGDNDAQADLRPTGRPIVQDSTTIASASETYDTDVETLTCTTAKEAAMPSNGTHAQNCYLTQDAIDDDARFHPNRPLRKFPKVRSDHVSTIASDLSSARAAGHLIMLDSQNPFQLTSEMYRRYEKHKDTVLSFPYYEAQFNIPDTPKSARMNAQLGDIEYYYYLGICNFRPTPSPSSITNNINTDMGSARPVRADVKSEKIKFAPTINTIASPVSDDELDLLESFHQRTTAYIPVTSDHVEHAVKVVSSASTTLPSTSSRSINDLSVESIEIALDDVFDAVSMLDNELKSELTAATIHPCHRLNALRHHGLVIPKSVFQIIDSAEWRKSFLKEWNGLVDKEVFVSTPRTAMPPDTTPIPLMICFDIKSDGTYKTRIVLRGDLTQQGIHFLEGKSSMASIESVRMLASIAVANDMELGSLDITQAYIHADEPNPHLYCKFPKFPPGLVGDGYDETCVGHMKKNLYGGKASARIFQQYMMDWVINTLNGRCFLNDSNVAEIFIPEGRIIVLMFVDDISVATYNKQAYRAFMKLVKETFNITEEPVINKFCGIYYVRDYEKKTLKLHQRPFAEQMLTHFNMWNETPAEAPFIIGDNELTENLGLAVPQQIFNYSMAVGCLMWYTRTNHGLLFRIQDLARFMRNPGEQHVNAIKVVFRYILGHLDDGTIYYGDSKILSLPYNFKNKLIMATDASYYHDGRKAVSGVAIFLNGAAIAVISRRQTTISCNTTEAEVKATALGVELLRFIIDLWSEFFHSPHPAVRCLVDNHGVVKQLENGLDRRASAPYRRAQAYGEEACAQSLMWLDEVHGTINPSDVLTKSVNNISEFQSKNQSLNGIIPHPILGNVSRALLTLPIQPTTPVVTTKNKIKIK